MPRALVFTLTALSACAQEASAPAEPPPLDVYDTRLVGDPAPDDEVVEVELVEPGREPRRRLRYRFEAGREQEVATIQRTRATMLSQGAQLMERELPPAHSEFLLRVTAVDDEGRARCELTLGDVSWLDWSRVLGSDGEVQQSLDDLRDHRVQVVMSARGRVVERDLGLRTEEVPAAGLFAEDTLRRLTDMLATPLPEEPIGVGGRWRVFRVSYNQGLFFPAEIEYEILELEDDRLVTRTSWDSDAPPQPLGPFVELRAFHSESDGREITDLSAPAPIELEMSSAFTMKVRPHRRDEPADFTMTMDETQTITSE